MSKTYIQITKKSHPHYREYGYLDLKDTVMGATMFRVDLQDCRHGNRGCYVANSDYEVIDE